MGSRLGLHMLLWIQLTLDFQLKVLATNYNLCIRALL